MNPYQIDQNGFYGNFGGAYVPESLQDVLKDLQSQYLTIIESAAFQQEFHTLLRDYVGPAESTLLRSSAE